MSAKYTLDNSAWFGELPPRWECKKISSLFAERKVKVSDKDYPPLSVAKIGVVPQLDTAVKTDAGDNRKLVYVGDFVINSRSDRKGSCGMSELDGSVSLINIVLTPRREWNSRYVHYLLRSQPFSEEYYRNGRGIVADLWTTRYSEMKSILLPVPPRPEQDQIVRFLDWKVSSINRLINIKRKEITVLKEQRQRKLSHIITHGLNPEVTMKKTNIRWVSSIPNHWKCVPLKRCAKVRSGITLGKKYPSGTHLIDVPYLRVANVQNGHVVLGSVTTLKVTPEEARQFQLPEGCVLMTEGGDRDKLGRGCVWNGEIANCIHQNHIFAVTVNDEVLYNKWLEFVSASDVGRVYFDLTAIRTTNLACTNASKVMALPVPLPPRYEQEIISTELQKILSEFDRIHNSLKSQIELLHELKARIIADVVTGKIDVRGIEIPEYEFVEETGNVEADSKEIVEEGLENE